MSSEVFQQSDALVEGRSAKAEPSARDWPAIGAGLVAAFVVIALYGISIWAIVILVQALV